jgi:hypothetical protein
MSQERASCTSPERQHSTGDEDRAGSLLISCEELPTLKEGLASGTNGGGRNTCMTS